MEINTLKKDRNGFVNLEDYIRTNRSQNHYVFTDEKIKYYYKKSSSGTTVDYESNKLAFSDPALLAEIVNCRIVEKLGLDAVRYHLAKIGTSYGVVSQDFYANHLDSIVLDDLLLMKDKEYNDNFDRSDCLKYISDKLYKDPINGNRLYGITDKQMNDLGLASLILVATGGRDGHIGNMAVYRDETDPAKDGVILYDFSNTYMNTLVDLSKIDNLERRYIDGKVMAIFGVEESLQQIDDYYLDLRISDYIQTKTIETYLNNFENFMTNNSGMKEVVEDIENEYGMKPDADYINGLNVILHNTGKEIEDAYDDRLMMVGE